MSRAARVALICLEAKVASLQLAEDGSPVPRG